MNNIKMNIKKINNKKSAEQKEKELIEEAKNREIIDFYKLTDLFRAVPCKEQYTKENALTIFYSDTKLPKERFNQLNLKYSYNKILDIEDKKYLDKFIYSKDIRIIINMPICYIFEFMKTGTIVNKSLNLLHACIKYKISFISLYENYISEEFSLPFTTDENEKAKSEIAMYCKVIDYIIYKNWDV